jgi:peroxiredoxin
MNNPSATRAALPASHWKRYRVLYAVLAVCIAPVLASYFAYYVAPPSGRTNYGTLIVPPRPVPATLRMTGLDGKEFTFRSLAGKWVMVSASPADCTEPCQSALLQMRQQRLMTGKEQQRVERVWLVTDDAPLSSLALRGYEGTKIVRAPAGAVREFLGLDGADASDGVVWLVDPMGNLMLRWPRDPEPQKVKKDLARLLTASSHWVRVERKD